VNSEDRFVAGLRALLPGGRPVLVGPGDDAAVLERAPGLLVATTDMVVEGVDFLPAEDPERLGRRAAAVNLSDLAAMGAEPEALLLAIGFRRERGPDYPLAITRGAAARGGEFGARLVGGDLSDAPLTIVTIALWGRPVGRPLTRSGAKPGDAVYLSGRPGEAAAGLVLARRLAAFAEQGAGPTPRFPGLTVHDEKELLAAYRDPEPRIALGAALSRDELATACIDVSDGVGVDAGRLAGASGVRLVLERHRLPVTPALRSFGELESKDPLDLLLSGGDDYELLFTAPSGGSERVEAAGAALGIRLSRVGRVEAGSGAVLEEAGGIRDIAALGYDHFRRAS
jgi:thiamine-monophosphate kinase